MRLSDVTDSGKLVDVLRWLCVLPAAVLGAVAVQFMVRGLVQVVDYVRWEFFGNSTIAYSLRLFFFYVPHKSAFVIAGAKMAPRQQMATAIALTLLAMNLSLVVHVVGQYLVGNNVGLVNFTHLSAESVGALAGAGCILLWTRRTSAVIT